jgi:hypothetical protein
MAAPASTRPYRRANPPQLPDNGRYIAEEFTKIEHAINAIPALPHSHAVDIRDLGAICDGAHAAEDTAAMIKAVALLGAGDVSDIVLPPSSTTLLNATISISSGAGRIIGSPSSVLKVADGAALGSAIEVDGGKISLVGFKIDGNRWGGGLSHIFSVGVVTFADDFSMINMELCECPMYGVAMFDTAGVHPQRAFYYRSHFHDIGQTIDVSDATHPYANIGTGIFGGSDFLSIQECRFKDINPVVAPLGDTGGVNVWGKAVSVERSTFIDCLNVHGGMIDVSSASGSSDDRAIIAHNKVEQTKRFRDLFPAATDDITAGIEINRRGVTDFEFVTRHRVFTDPDERYIFEIDEYRRGADQLLQAHFRFFKFSPSALKSALKHWRLFRSVVTAPLVCWGEDDGDTWKHFVSLFGFKPLHQSILCNNGARRELYTNIVPHGGINRHLSKTVSEPEH